MQKVPNTIQGRSVSNRREMPWVSRGLTLACLLGATVGCEPAEAPAAPRRTTSQRAETLQSPNGLSVNGLSVNGLSVNGLSVNGLSVNGLSTQAFREWFNLDPALNDVTMRYVVRCAMSESESLTWLNPRTGEHHTWTGQLALAPGWSAGLPPSVSEQQAITACLAAHANKFGLHISISVLGRDALGLPIPFTNRELTTYSEREACFFGNLFTHEGIHAANDRPELSADESTSRACGLSSDGDGSGCAPIAHEGACEDFCTLDPTRTYYTHCTFNGVTYRPLTTRILPSDIYRCGDGVCQHTEGCGTGHTVDNCGDDCGKCPDASN
ncbi:hypothetical protein [Stigmatella aurantiaca]|uniref:Conserved uncharacterized protein n=1 Tax=Stigmatella aurantiaca (strain DW4/3-1) TaxID=378806 RepID=Q08ZR7_STIAD|nr:hypothetical protein [Stigmatella aurantiaca]ADO74819.1 conserved uncharacterized protein [Stigmatella aurantiaca DW4/3-1]EAU65979.1 conserved hypothetical protein [Stigmatella aurantiaca DW4/3-1]